MFFFCCMGVCFSFVFVCFFQAEDGIRDLVRSRGLGDVYKRQYLKKHDPAEREARREARRASKHGDGSTGSWDPDLSLIHI